MAKKKDFTPDWYEGKLPPAVFAPYFKWHDPDAFKHPNHGFYALIRDTFDLSDADFRQPQLCLQIQ